jgi:Polyketide cyclase / dehydrase and lipid transport
MAKLTVTVTVNAGPAEVWAVLCDLARYPEWHPYVLKATGEIQPGSQVFFTEALQGRRRSTYPLRVEVAQPGAELQLRPLGTNPRIDTGFTLSPVDSGTHTEVVYSNIFRGALSVAIFWLGLNWIPAPHSRLRVLMRKVTQALKHRVEHDTGAT